MMLVLIKSFNRPWALDRCLHSLTNIAGISKTIVVDDGTEEKYLSILKNKYPHTIFHTDPRNAGKVARMRERGITPVELWNGIDPNKIWVAQAKKHSDGYFMLHEDDGYTPQPFNVNAILADMKSAKAAYIDLTGKFGRACRYDKTIDNRENIDIIANSRPWSWFAAAFCLYRTDLFEALYGSGLGGQLQQGELLVTRAKNYYARTKLCGGYAKGPAKIIISDTIAARYNQRMNDALNTAWLKGDLRWHDYYPDLVPLNEILAIFRKAKIPEDQLQSYNHWRKDRFRQYRMPYGLDGKIRWDDT